LSSPAWSSTEGPREGARRCDEGLHLLRPGGAAEVAATGRAHHAADASAEGSAARQQHHQSEAHLGITHRRLSPRAVEGLAAAVWAASNTTAASRRKLIRMGSKEGGYSRALCAALDATVTATAASHRCDGADEEKT
jgi:hypothetical protein